MHASLAIEDNSLTLDEVGAVDEGRSVVAPAREVREVQNAFAAYDRLADWSPTSRVDLLQAHGLLMAGLIDDPGHFRQQGVGIYRGNTLLHVAPPADRVPLLMDDLLDWLGQTDLHPAVASSLFHYELEFIHPFSDGNGRMGRLWQSLILARWHPWLAFVSFEALIHERRDEYYSALSASDQAGDGTHFLEFALTALADTLDRSEKSSEKSSEKILAQLALHPHASARELAEFLGLSSRAVEKQIAELKLQGRLWREGGARGGRWRVGRTT